MEKKQGKKNPELEVNLEFKSKDGTHFDDGKLARKKTEKKFIRRTKEKKLQCTWLNARELKIIEDYVAVLSKLDTAIDNINRDVVRMTGSSVVASSMVKLIQNWSHCSVVAGDFSAYKIGKTFMKLVNPDIDVQTLILLSLAGSKYNTVDTYTLVQTVASVIKGYTNMPENRVQGLSAGTSRDHYSRGSAGAAAPSSAAMSDLSAEAVARALLHPVLFTGLSPKQSFGAEVPSDFITKERLSCWLLSQSSLYLMMQLAVLRRIVAPGLPPLNSLLPTITRPKLTQIPLTTSELLFLNASLPISVRGHWRLLYSNTIHDECFSVLTKQITNAGPTVVLIEDEEGHRFGGFASASWEIKPQFHGTSQCLLFSLSPKLGVFPAIGYNDNYQYLSHLSPHDPNGLGMGGCKELFGFFLSSDFSELRVAPSCLTFNSPRLCPNERPRLRSISVWRVSDPNEEWRQPEERRPRSALHSNPEARALLLLAGKTTNSLDLYEPESSDD